MTPLTATIKRLLPRPIERGEWTVMLDSVGVTFRQKRCRARYAVSWESIWKRAMEQAAEEARRARREKRRRVR